MSYLSRITVAACFVREQEIEEIFDLFAFAMALQELVDGQINGIIIGKNARQISQTIAQRFGVDVTAFYRPDIPNYTSEYCLNVFEAEFKSSRPSHICMPHNSRGWDLAPSLAVKLRAACITGVSGLELKSGHICYQKALYTGKVSGNMVSRSDITVLTVQPDAFKSKSDIPRRLGKVVHKTVSHRPEYTSSLGVRQAAADRAEITEADIIVAAGKGMGNRENMEMIYSLAKLFHRSAVAGTRVVCDNGWLGYHQQVGMTGASVSPRLYIACGISGAMQHIMGIRQAGMIIAINTDKQAAIFNSADICIVEDATTFLPLLFETYKKKKEAP